MCVISQPCVIPLPALALSPFVSLVLLSGPERFVGGGVLLHPLQILLLTIIIIVLMMAVIAKMIYYLILGIFCLRTIFLPRGYSTSSL